MCVFKKKEKKCRDPGSNRGPLDLQSNALPTELSRPVENRFTKEKSGEESIAEAKKGC